MTEAMAEFNPPMNFPFDKLVSGQTGSSALWYSGPPQNLAQKMELSSIIITKDHSDAILSNRKQVNKRKSLRYLKSWLKYCNSSYIIDTICLKVRFSLNPWTFTKMSAELTCLKSSQSHTFCAGQKRQSQFFKKYIKTLLYK